MSRSVETINPAELETYQPREPGTQEPIPDRYISTLHAPKLLCLIIIIIHDVTRDLVYGPSTNVSLNLV